MADDNDPFRIDEANLDWEWRRQPRMTRRAIVAAADARHAVAKAAARLKLIEAELQLQVRVHPERFDVPSKLTEAIVDAAVLLQPAYQTALASLNQLQYDLDVFQADVAAMVDRRKALEKHVELLAIDYYTDREPRVSGSVKEAVHERSKEAARRQD